MHRRFAKIENKDIERLKEKQKNKHTGLATSNWVRVFQSWAHSRGLQEVIENYNVQELNTTLEKFYAEVRRQNGKEYEPDSLSVMQSCLDRYLRENDYKVSITQGREFQSSQRVLEGKIRQLRQENQGKKPNSKVLSKQDEEILWNCGQLGGDSPKSLQNTMWLYLSRYFGVKGRQEHYTLRVEYFQLKKNSQNDQEYLACAENWRNTNIPSEKRQKLAESKMCSMPGMPKRCPIALYKKYISKRPINSRTSGPFYLGCLDHANENSVWYKSMPLGINSVNHIMKSMIENSPLSSNRQVKHYLVIPRKCDVFEQNNNDVDTNHHIHIEAPTESKRSWQYSSSSEDISDDSQSLGLPTANSITDMEDEFNRLESTIVNSNYFTVKNTTTRETEDTTGFGRHLRDSISTTFQIEEVHSQ